MRKNTLLLLGVVLALAAVPCWATEITFAEFDSLSGPDITVSYSNPGTPTNTITESAPVNFQYLNITPAPVGLSGTLPANLVINASTTSPVNTFPFDYQQLYSGTFSIELSAPHGGYPTGYNLLSGTFGPSSTDDLAGGGTTFTFSDSTPPTTAVVLSSSLLEFGPGAQGFSLTLSGVSNTGLTGGFFSGFNATDGGTFSANVIPEPFSFLLLGSGLVGLGLLRRKLR